MVQLKVASLLTVHWNSCDRVVKAEDSLYSREQLLSSAAVVHSDGRSAMRIQEASAPLFMLSEHCSLCSMRSASVLSCGRKKDVTFTSCRGTAFP